MGIAFAKYHGLGNDFILLDCRAQTEPPLSPERAARLCDRHFGIGADGVIFALGSGDGAGDGANYAMRIFNADGSEPEMCGNGIRCLARFLADLETGNGLPAAPPHNAPPPAERAYRIRTLAGIIVPRLRPDGQVTVDMGEPILDAGRIPTTLVPPDEKAIAHPLEVAGKVWQVTTVSMGNPHCIVFADDAAAIPLETLGPQFETHPAFPQKTNVEFVRVAGPDALHMRVWERGAGATLACGTGACATLVAGVLTGRCDRRATVTLPGGPLDIEWSAADGRLFMTGPAECAFVGTIADD